MTVSPKILSYKYIQSTAENFLNKFHHSLTLPIPIEEIVELR